MEKAYFIAVKWLERYVGLQNAYKQYSHDRHLPNFVAAVVSILMRPSFLSTQKSPEEEIKAERKI